MTEHVPKWKRDHLEEFAEKERRFNMCIKCVQLGDPTDKTHHLGYGQYIVYVCRLNGCLCTQWSLGCKDYVYSPGWLDRIDVESPY